MVFLYDLMAGIPLLITLILSVISIFSTDNEKWKSVIIGLLLFLLLYFAFFFFVPHDAHTIETFSLFDLSFNKISLFIGMIFCASLFVGIYPLRHQVIISSSFLFYITGGIGLILANNLPTFFLFWSFQRAIPLVGFFQSAKRGDASIGATYIIQHVISFFCLVALLVMSYNQGYLYYPMTSIPKEFFSWPVLILSFIVIYQSHGIFPFHSWVHDLVGKHSWYEISSIFLSRSGVLLFVQLLLPTFSNDPDIFKIILLSLSIISSIYWSFRGLFEENLSKTTTYFYIAQASLLLTGLQADLTAAKGSYLHMMVISLCGTSMFSILSYIQHYFSIKRANQFYGLAQFYPRLSTLFCLFGFCMIGVPMGASHVVEDLVITGLLDYQPYLGLGHIVATCLNGILFFIVYSKFFLGQSPYKQHIKVMDMSMKEMAPYVSVLMLMLLMGVLPYLFLEKLTW